MWFEGFICTQGRDANSPGLPRKIKCAFEVRTPVDLDLLGIPSAYLQSANQHSGGFLGSFRGSFQGPI